MFLIVALVLLFVLPSPWNVLAFLGSLVVLVGEVLFWNRTVRGKRVRAGSETMIGQRAIVVSACRPDGQVRVSGELWEARCAEGADPGDPVVVTGRERLRLVVTRTDRA